VKRNKLIILSLILLVSFIIIAACSNTNSEVAAPTEGEAVNSGVVNIYTDRHYETDDELYKMFTDETGIVVNVVKGDSDELIERLSREGEATEADLLITADAGRLHRAKEKELLQPVISKVLNANIPEQLRDADNEWFGLTVRARVIVYSKDRVNPKELSTYEDLTDPKWKGKVLVRSSTNIYNQSLLASFIAISGEDKAKEWAAGIVNNLAREPKGNDRDQAKAIVAGEGDVAIMNTYYVGKMLNSTDPEEVKVAEQVGVFFPNQETTGTHINISGAGVTKYSPNAANALKLIEFLSGEQAQKQYAEANYEYPVNDSVEPSELLKTWGEFQYQDINLTKLGENNSQSIKIFNQVGWK